MADFIVTTLADEAFDGNEAPTLQFIANPQAGSVTENVASSRTERGLINLFDDGIGTNHLALSGPHADLFEIVGFSSSSFGLYFKAGTVPNYEAVSAYTVTVDDLTIGDGPENSFEVTVPVTNVDEPAVTASQTITLQENGVRTLTAADFPYTDPEGVHSMSAVEIISGPSDGKLYYDPTGGDPSDAILVTGSRTVTVGALNNNQLWFVPDSGESGTGYASFRFQVVDSQGLSNVATMTFDVTPTNEAPAVLNAIADQSVNEDELWLFDVPFGAFSDPNGDSLTYTATLANGDPLPGDWLSFDGTTFSGRPPTDFNGAIELTVTASDGLASVSDTFTLTVTPVNDAPVGNAITDQSSSEDTPWSFQAPAFSDVDGDTLTYRASLGNGSALPAWLRFDPGSLTFAGTPPPNYNGMLDLRVVASDGVFLVPAFFQLTVTPLNDGPVVINAIADQVSKEDSPWSFQVPANVFFDIDGDPLTCTASLGDGSTLPAWLSFDAATRTFSGTPPRNFNGAIDIKVTASDDGLSASDTFRLTVTPMSEDGGDFTGDGLSDILWHNLDGRVGLWQIAGRGPQWAGTVGEAGGHWTITDAADFNGDGKSDVLLRNDDGRVGLWEMNGQTIAWAGAIGTVNSAWHLTHAADVNGDGTADILLRNASDGRVGLWEMNGHGVAWAGAIATVDLSWHIAETGDFNGDGKADILWRNDDGRIGTWEMNDNTIAWAGTIATVDAGWEIADTGDFNGDGKSDILWRDTRDGRVGLWEMDGHALAWAGTIGTLDPSWQIARASDFNGDGKADILLRNDDGRVGLWEMNGSAIAWAGTIGTADSSWQVAAHHEWV